MKKIHLMLVLLFAFAVVTCTSGVASAYLSTEYVGNTMVDLSWTQYESTDFSKYELYRDGSLINTISDRTVTFYRDTGLTKGHTYIYEIRSYDTTDKYRSDTTSATTGEVEGTITQDTTWTVASSPYTLTKYAVEVRNGATLTIESGVMVKTVLVYGSVITVREKGALYADGVSFSGVGLDISDASHADIKNCSFENECEIFLFSSDNNVITGNTLSNNGTPALSLDNSSNNVIAGNTFLNANFAICILDSSNKNDIIDNNASSNDLGVFLDNSSNNVITGNILSNNRWEGIALQNSSNNVITNNTALNNNGGGIDLICSSNNNVISSNTASNNSYDGIFLDNSSNNVIANNTVSNNNDTGIYLENSSNNKIYNNYFNNTDNAYDDGNNTWNITKTPGTNIVGGPYLGGNYWSDYNGTDLDGDRLGDTLLPYNCSGGIKNSGDYHPLLPPSQYIVGVYEITSKVIELIEENNGTVIDQCQYEDGPRALLVNISEQGNIDDFINNVQNSPLVKYVEPNRIVHTCYIPNDSLYPWPWNPYGPRQWGLWNITAGITAGSPPNLPPRPSAWDVEKGDKNITIAIVDTGIQYNHTDLNRSNDGTIKYVYGYDWVGMDDNPYPVLTIEDHGTHCTGIATAVMDNFRGIAGIAPNCSFIAERVMFLLQIGWDPDIWVGTGFAWNISRGIMDAADHDADIISMSFGDLEPSEFERDATLYASTGSILVAAAGNDANEGIRYPAAYPWVIAVGATNQQNLRAPFSNWGTELELVAPGVLIWSTIPWDTYDNNTVIGTGTGTSMATPHVAGVAALVKSRAERWPPEPLATDPWYHLNNNQIHQVLVQSAVDLGSPGWDKEYGYGKVDAARAVRCVNISGNVLEAVLNVPIPHPPGAPFPPEVRVTSIEGPEGIYTTNENTTIARITKDGDYFVRVPQGVYSICAMAYGYIPSRGLGGERIELPAFDFLGNLNTDYRELRLVPFPCNVTGNVTDSVTELPIKDASVSLNGPPHIYPPHPNVHMDTKTDPNGNYHFILEYGVHLPYPTGEAVYNITVRKSGYQTQTQNFTLNWSDVVTDYYKCQLSPLDYNPPIVNFSLLSGPSELPDMMLTRDDIRVIFNENATVSATIHNIGTADASNIVVQFFDGDPDAGGTQIGTDQTISSIEHESTGTVQETRIAIPGTHDIFVRVDPYNTISEARENNNQAYKQITVSGKKTIYVDDDFTDDPANHKWNTIQEGINDANDGDTVLVYNGTYNENVVLNKTLTLVGEGMPTIDAQSLGDAINITADNCTVKGFSCVNAQPSPYAGIHVESGNNVIEDNTCRDNNEGIYLSSSLNKIRNNIANYNHYQGIGLGTSSDNNTIVNNTAKNNGNNGIYLKESNNNKIANNTVNSNNFDGIRLRSHSNNNIVTNNMANSNKEAGILCLTSSDNILIYNNLSLNSFGIWLHNYSTENIVANNTANSNYHYAILVRWSSNNNIYLNNFIANIYNVYSYNSNNIWNSPSKITYTYNGNTYTNYLGNYWSDYNGSDADGDGIGEDPYIIDGDKDYYPLMERFEKLTMLQVQ